MDTKEEVNCTPIVVGDATRGAEFRKVLGVLFIVEDQVDEKRSTPVLKPRIGKLSAGFHHDSVSGITALGKEQTHGA